MSSHGAVDTKVTPQVTPPSPDHEKAEVAQLEQVSTQENPPGKGHYVEEDGLRTEGDGVVHHDTPMTTKRKMALVAQAFLWTGSQIPVYLFGGIPPYIYGDLGGTDRWVWFVLANLLALAGVCPFVGSMSDLLGRRYVALMGAAFIVVGMIICSTAQDMNTFIAGMVFAGVGAGINELTALAATSELAPTSKRGIYVGALIFTIVPFCPSVLWGQLIAYHSSWRYVGLFCALWAFIGLVLTAVFYFPPPRVNSTGLSRRDVLKRIDYVGGLTSISGMVLFMAGMQWGGYQYPWTSAHALVPLILGAALLVAFGIWEAKFAPYPMFPKRLNQAPKVLTWTLVITFISGANFFSILMFWPVQAFNVYGHDPVQVGIRGLPVGFGIMFGAVIVLILLSVFRGRNKTLMVVSSVLMTTGCGAIAVADVDNMSQLWGILVLAGLGIGGIVVPASIITTIICPDDLIATVAALTLSIRVIGGSIGYCVYFDEMVWFGMRVPHWCDRYEKSTHANRAKARGGQNFTSELTGELTKILDNQNVFVSKFTPASIKYIGGVLVENGITSTETIAEVIGLTTESLIDRIADVPGIAGNPALFEAVVKAGQIAYAESYKYVYYSSIAFGSVSIVAALFLGDISQFMDDHVAVVM